MKHMNPKIVTLLHEGFSISTLEKMNKVQVNLLYEKVKKSKKEDLCPCGCKKNNCTCGPNCKKCDCGKIKNKEMKEQPVAKVTNKTVKQIELPVGSKTTVSGNYSVSNDAGKTVLTQTEGEMTEKSVSKKQHGLMGAAYSVEKGEKELKDIPKSYRKKVEKVVDSMSKKQIKDFAKTKTDKLPEKKESKKSETKKIEENIMNLIKKHIYNEVSKKEVLNILNKK